MPKPADTKAAEDQRQRGERERRQAEEPVRLSEARRESEQKLAEALQARETDLSEAQRLAHIGSWYWDAATDVTTGSDELLRIYGLDPATQTMPNFKDQSGRQYPVGDWERLNAAVKAALETGVGYELDLRVIRGGAPIWVTARGEVVRDAQNRLVGLRGTVQDITARKRTEEELKKAHGQLEARVHQRTAELQKTTDTLTAERQRFREALDLLPAYVILLSPDYHVPFANRFFEGRFGKSEGRRCYEYLFNRTAPCENCETYKVLKTNAPHRWEWTGPDGHNYDIYDYPFTDADGSNLIMEVGLDITEVRRAQAALKQVNETLEQRVASRTAELRATNDELTRFNRAAVGRELRMIELKQQINALCAQLGQPPRYPLKLEPDQK